MSLNQLLVAMLSVGGFGFLNFVIADNIGTIEFKEYSVPFVVGYSILWSIPDVLIYTVVYHMLIVKVSLSKLFDVWISLGITCVFVVLFTPVLSMFLERCLNRYYSHFREKVKSDKYLSLRGSLKKYLISQNDVVYVYDRTHELIESGVVWRFNPNESEIIFLDYVECDFIPNIKYVRLISTIKEVNELVEDTSYICVRYFNLNDGYIIVDIPASSIKLFNKCLFNNL